MNLRLVLALILFAGPLAFAPAPLPRRDREMRAGEIDAARLQGDWRVSRWQVLSEQGQALNASWNFTLSRVSIRSNRWTFAFSDNTSLTLPFAVESGARPAHLNFYALDDPRRLTRVGLIQRHAGKVQVVYRILDDGGNESRPIRFDPQPKGTYALTLEREDPKDTK